MVISLRYIEGVLRTYRGRYNVLANSHDFDTGSMTWEEVIRRDERRVPLESEEVADLKEAGPRLATARAISTTT